MSLRVRGRRIDIDLYGDRDERELQHAELSSIIGSIYGESDAPSVSCAFSIANLRKLKRLGHGLSPDEVTRKAIATLKARNDEYLSESAVGDRAKLGEVVACPDYVFKGEEPFDHQRRGFQFLHSMKAPGLLGDCGTGKTAIVSWYAESLKQREAVFFLVICPVNLIAGVWIREIAKYTNLTALSLRDTPAKRLLAADWQEGMRRDDPDAIFKAKAASAKRHKNELKLHYDQDVDAYIANFELIAKKDKVERVLKLCKRRIASGNKMVLIVDESTRLKSSKSNTYKSAMKLRKLSDRCVIMTGTPSPNGVKDLWSQFNLLDGGMTLQPAQNDFMWDTHEEIVLRNVKTKGGGSVKTWKQKRTAAREVHNLITPRTIRFRAEDVISLPGKTFNVREVDMNTEQQQAYEAMEKMLYAEVEGESVTARVSMVKLMKLREITGGFITNDSGDDMGLGKSSPKMVELDSLLEQSIADKLEDGGPPSKALIWANYRWECKSLVKRYQKYGAHGLFGGISKKAKDDAIERFKSDPDCRILVCHPASAGHGLTLVEANYSFYYSLSYNFEEFYQSYKRIVRPGQKRRMVFYFLVCPGTIDDVLLKVIRNKKDISDIITDGRISSDELIRLDTDTWDL